jgi:hypothetical protein
MHSWSQICQVILKKIHNAYVTPSRNLTALLRELAGFFWMPLFNACPPRGLVDHRQSTINISE